MSDIKFIVCLETCSLEKFQVSFWIRWELFSTLTFFFLYSTKRHLCAWKTTGVGVAAKQTGEPQSFSGSTTGCSTCSFSTSTVLRNRWIMCHDSQPYPCLLTYMHVLCVYDRFYVLCCVPGTDCTSYRSPLSLYVQTITTTNT